MRQAKAFFFVCAGLLLLALAYHLGARSAGAQAPSNPVVCSEPGIVYTANGDAYERTGNPYHWNYAGNIFGGSGPTPAQRMTIGQLKARYATPAGRP